MFVWLQDSNEGCALEKQEYATTGASDLQKHRSMGKFTL